MDSDRVTTASNTARARGRSVLGAVLVLASVLLTPLPRAAAEDPAAEDDPFYSAPADLAGHPEGAVIRSRAVALFGLPLPVSAWQVLYRSRDSADRPVADVTTIMVPNMPWFGGGPRPLLSYQVAVDSLGARCAPSRALLGGWSSGFNTLVDFPFMVAALLRGWAVATSDYDGPDARFLDGVNAGRGVLDGVRAALAFAPAALDPASPVGAYGYSGGAYATLWAAELRASYAPEIRLTGVSAGGVPADWLGIARHVEGTGQAGLAMMILHTVARNDPANGVGDLLNDRGRAMLAEDAAACGEELLPKYAGARIDDFTTVAPTSEHPAFRAAVAAQELGGRAPSVPTHLFHSVSDDVIPSAGFTALIDRYCALGADLTYRNSPVPGHNPAALVEFTGAMNRLADRFAGQPVSPGCRAG